MASTFQFRYKSGYNGMRNKGLLENLRYIASFMNSRYEYVIKITLLGLMLNALTTSVTKLRMMSQLSLPTLELASNRNATSAV